MIVTPLQYTTNLDSGVQMTPLKNSFLSGDQEAHRFTVSCFRSTSRQSVDLTGAGVTGYFIRADQSTVVISGKVEDNCAVLTLPAACYAKQGRFSLVIKASLGDVIHTILWVEGAVSLSHTGTIIDPGEVVPTLDELLAQIAAMEIATNNANTAANNANQAAADALKNVDEAVARQDEVIGQLSEEMVGYTDGAYVNEGSINVINNHGGYYVAAGVTDTPSEKDGFLFVVPSNERFKQKYFYSNGHLYYCVTDSRTGNNLVAWTDINDDTKIDSLYKTIIDENVDEVNKKIYGLYTSSNTYGFLKADGSLTDRSAQKDYFVSDYIFVRAGEGFAYRLKHETELPIVCVYADRGAKDGTPAVIGKNAYVEGVYTASDDCYIRFCWSRLCTDGYVRFTDGAPDNVRHYIEPLVNHNGVSGLRILCLGDSIFGNDGEIVENLRNMTKATLYNGGFGGTSVSLRNGESDNYSFFDGTEIVRAITTGDFSGQDAVIGSIPTGYYAGTLAMLKTLDMSQIDLITLAWGTNDYTQGKTIEQITAAYGEVIDMLHTAYPAMRILIITPIWRYFDDGDGDTKLYNASTLREIAYAIDAYAKQRRISVLNSYDNMPLDQYTAATYFDPGDRTHLNAAGNLVYAHLINGKIQSLY